MNKKLASNLNLSNIDMLDYRIAANYLENAGDLIAELVSYLSELKEKKQIAELIGKRGIHWKKCSTIPLRLLQVQAETRRLR